MHGYPLNLVDFCASLWVELSLLWIDSLHEVEGHHTVPDCLHLDKPVFIDIILQFEAGLFVYFSSCAFYGLLILVDLSFREVKFSNDAVSWIVIDNEQEFV